MSGVPHTPQEGKSLWWKTAKAVTHCLEAAASRQARILSYLSHVNLNGGCVCVCVCVCVCGYLPSITKVSSAKWKTAGVTPKWGFLDVYRRIYTGMQFLPVSFPTQLLCFYWRNYLPGKASDINILHTNTYEWSLHTNSYECWYIKLSFKVVSLTSQGTNMEKHTYS